MSEANVVSRLRIPPHSKEAELAVIGQLLTIEDRITQVGDLSADDFYAGFNRDVYRAILELFREGTDINVIFVADKLGFETMEPLEEFILNLSGGTNFAAYLKIIREKASRRRSIMAAQQLVADEWDEVKNAKEKYMNSMAAESDGSDWNMQTALKASVERLDALHRKAISPGIKTGIGLLDDVCGGLQGSHLMIVAGRPGMGKTAFMLNMINNMSCPIGVISAEMQTRELTDRLIAMNSRIEMQKFQNGQIAEQEWPRLTKAVTHLDKRKLFFNDKEAITVGEVQQQATAWKRAHDIQALFVDYLQFLEGEGENRTRVVDAISKGLKNTAKRLGIPVVCLAQLSRNLEGRSNKRPELYDLKDSGSIEQDADEVVFLYRDSVYNENANANEIEINLAKNRHGPTGQRKHGWLPEFGLVQPLVKNDTYEGYEQESLI